MKQIKINLSLMLFIIIFNPYLSIAQVKFQAVNCFGRSIALSPTPNASINLEIIKIVGDKMLLGGTHYKLYGNLSTEIINSWNGYNVYVIDLGKNFYGIKKHYKLLKVNYRNMEGTTGTTGSLPNTSSISFKNIYITDDNKVEVLTDKPRESNILGKHDFQFELSRYSFDSTADEETTLINEGADGILDYHYLDERQEDKLMGRDYRSAVFKKKTPYGEYMAIRSSNFGANAIGKIWFYYYDKDGKCTKEIMCDTKVRTEDKEAGTFTDEYLYLDMFSSVHLIDDNIFIPLTNAAVIRESETGYLKTKAESLKFATFSLEGELLEAKYLKGVGDKGDTTTVRSCSSVKRYGDTLVFVAMESYTVKKPLLTDDTTSLSSHLYRAVVEYNLKTGKIEKYTHFRPRRDYTITSIVKIKNDGGYYFVGGKNEELKVSQFTDPINGKISNTGEILWIQMRSHQKGVSEMLFSIVECDDDQNYYFLYSSTTFEEQPDKYGVYQPKMQYFELFRTYKINDNSIEAEPVALISSTVYPNPTAAENIATVRLELEDACDLRIVLSDVLGKEIMQIHEGFTDAGTFTKSFTTQHLQKGVYFLKTLIGGQYKIEKIVVND